MVKLRAGKASLWSALLLSALTFSAVAKSELKQPPGSKKLTPVSSQGIEALRHYAKQHGYSTRYGIFADLALHSGKKRLFIIDLQTHGLVQSALVTHGHCKEDESEVRFSNIQASNCSSQGKYSIGQSYFGSFGLAFKLHGLDHTNSNAFSRAIVLHAHECVYDKVWPVEICESEGCPTVSPHMLLEIQKLIKSEVKPLLLWVYKGG